MAKPSRPARRELIPVFCSDATHGPDPSVRPQGVRGVVRCGFRATPVDAARLAAFGWGMPSLHTVIVYAVGLAVLQGLSEVLRAVIRLFPEPASTDEPPAW